MDLVTLDLNQQHRPDVVFDLNIPSLPFRDESADEIHAYDVLEHCGRQGDWKFFFDQFTDFHRVLKPDGTLHAICPSWKSMWAWGDPSHTRVLTQGSLVFLMQDSYKTVGVSPMSDFRFCYKVDFAPVVVHDDEDRFYFILRKK